MTLFSNNSDNPCPYAVTLTKSELFIAQRAERFFVVTLNRPHRVYSTSQQYGGESRLIRYLVNHQSMEANDPTQALKVLSLDDKDYHEYIAGYLSLPPEEMALMGTAISMSHIAHAQRSFKGLSVDVFVTAGVGGNAQRAGDDTQWYETDGVNKPVQKGEESHALNTMYPINISGTNAVNKYFGTINTTILINKPVTAGTQAKIAMLIVEAKAAALAELSVFSTTSPHLATGTGTDQFIIAAPLNDESAAEYTSASGHLKLGELVGEAVKSATRDALLWQDQKLGNQVRSVGHALSRFGYSKQGLLDTITAQAGDDTASHACNNYGNINTNSRVVATAYAYASILDRIEYGVLPKELKNEMLRDQAANTAVALSGKPHYWPGYWQSIPSIESDLLIPFYTAISLGWKTKWRES